MKFKSELNLLFLINLVIFICGEKSTDDECIIANSQEKGVCKPITECPSVLNNAIKNIKTPTQCGFQGRVEIACCPTSSSVKVKRASGSETNSENLRISEKKCNDYKSAVYTNALHPLSGSETKVDKCYSKSPSLVPSVRPRELPHMALIGMDIGDAEPKWICGGSLISDEFILTAAHCVWIKVNEVKFVRLGDISIKNDTDDAAPETYNIKEIISHPEYFPLSLYNDIALLRLDRKVQFDPYKRPACLPTIFDSPGEHAVGTVWGLTASDESISLQKSIKEIYNNQKCNEFYKGISNLGNGVLWETQICAGSKATDGKYGCRSGSGGPLQVDHPDHYCMYSLIGILSFGQNCASTTPPLIYTRIYSYLEWIENIVWKTN